jgi:hypothetical protein
MSDYLIAKGKAIAESGKYTPKPAAEKRPWLDDMAQWIDGLRPDDPPPSDDVPPCDDEAAMPRI